MTGNASRPIPFNTHPLVQQTYILPTPSIDEAYGTIKEVIRHRTPGALMYGYSRFGKTYAVRYVCSILREDFPNIATLIYLCQRKKRPVESAFFENFLSAAGHRDPLSGTTSAKRMRLTNFLVEQVKRSGLNLLILFADEAHRLESIEYDWLHDIHSNLERYGIRMITFLVGHQKLLNQKNAFKAQGETPIIGRFMIDEIAFRGVRDADDVATCLQGYDEACHPIDSDWSFTRFFFPSAHDKGMRLVDQANGLWKAFSEAHHEARFPFDIDIPMQYFARAVEIALVDNATHDAPEFQWSPAIWQQAVKASKYVIAIEELHLQPDLDG